MQVAMGAAPSSAGGPQRVVVEVPAPLAEDKPSAENSSSSVAQQQQQQQQHDDPQRQAEQLVEPHDDEEEHIGRAGSSSGLQAEPSASGSVGAGPGGVKPPFLYRLFVGWVPKNYVEKDLLPLFGKYGVVKDVIVLKDKVTHQPRGCAFLSYATKHEAELAIQNLDRKVQLPGALSLLEVRFAKSHQYVQAGTGPDDNRQLFFTAAPGHLNEQDISQIFSQFGVVEEVNLFRDRKTGSSKGCGFITLQTRAQACAAMDALEHKSAEPSEQMSVQWADPELQFKKKKALEESNADNRMLFFAKVLRSASEEDVKRLFSRFGRVYDINLFRAFQGAPTTKGCGLVTMGTHEEARAAIEGLDSRFCWEGMDSPMVVKWMDAALQRRRREQHLANMLQGLSPSLGGPGASDPWLGPHAAKPMPGAAALLGAAPGARLGAPMAPALLLPQMAEAEVEEVPPVGCQPDTFKLFIGNIPKACTEDQLLPFFESIGTVAELVIVRDKAQQSKGSAFVWYAHRAHAERAILQFNLRHVLPDPTGEQDRPLVVRRARTRVGKPLLGGSGAAAVLTGLPVALGGMGGLGGGGGGGGTPMSSSAMSAVINAAAGGQVKASQGLAGLGLGGPSSLGHGQPHVHPAVTFVTGPGPGGAMHIQGLGPGGAFYGGPSSGGVSAAAAASKAALLHHPHHHHHHHQALGLSLEQQQQQQQLALQHAGLSGGYMLQQPGGVGYHVAAAPGGVAHHHHHHAVQQHQQPHLHHHPQGHQQQHQQQHQQLHQQLHHVVHHHQQAGAQLVSIQAAPAVSEMGLYEAYGMPGGDARGMLDRYMLASSSNAAVLSSSTLGGGGDVVVGNSPNSATLSVGTPSAAADPTGGGGGGGGTMALSLQLTLQQLGVVNTHLYSIQSMSGAQVTISPGVHGLFHLLVSGTKPQVDGARSLVSQVLGLAV